MDSMIFVDHDPRKLNDIVAVTVLSLDSRQITVKGQKMPVAVTFEFTVISKRAEWQVAECVTAYGFPLWKNAREMPDDHLAFIVARFTRPEYGVEVKKFRFEPSSGRYEGWLPNGQRGSFDPFRLQ